MSDLGNSEDFSSIRYDELANQLVIIDQRELPGNLVYIRLSSLDEIYQAIKTLAVRGAPAIGITAAWGMAIRFVHLADEYSIADSESMAIIEDEFHEAMSFLSSSRPTAVNLPWALSRMENCFMQCRNNGLSLLEMKHSLLDEAAAIQYEDAMMCQAIAENALALLAPSMTLLTHCNAGSLATAKYGTALAPIYLGQSREYGFRVFSTETRPLLQGSRLTVWELMNAGVDVTLICDSMAAHLMQVKGVDAIMVGADRVSANGDTANKIGTLSLAIAAKHFSIPFYVLCPSSTIDNNTLTGAAIEIEERSGDEVRMLNSQRIAPMNSKVYNPAFDVTPSSLISAIITERGVYKQPYGF